MAETIGLFAIKTVGLSRVNGRKPCTLLEAARHNLREIQIELGAVGHIDPKRMVDNIIMAGPSTAAQVQAHADALLASVDTTRLKRDHVQAVEVVFSLPAGSSLDVGLYFARCVEWLRVALPLPIVSAIAHRDESAPHAHILMLPVVEGRHVGGGLIDKPKLLRLRDAFFQKVAGPAGLKRDSAKVRGPVKQWAVDAVLRQCVANGLHDGMGPLWGVFKGMVEKDPTPCLLALNIDVNTLRESSGHVALEQQSPIALGRSPIALGVAIESEVVLEGSKIEGQSCVALAHQLPQIFTQKAPHEVHPSAPAEAITTLVELWARVGLRSLWKTPPPAVPHTRMAVAKAALQAALAKPCRQRQRVSAGPVVHVDDGGIVRERGGEGCHDTAAWMD